MQYNIRHSINQLILNEIKSVIIFLILISIKAYLDTYVKIVLSKKTFYIINLIKKIHSIKSFSCIK